MLNKRKLYIEEWLLFAKEDLAMAKLALDVDNVFNRSICYHCQQSAEKDLRAYIIYLGLELHKTHSIAHLIEQILFVDKDVAIIYEEATKLTKYIVAARYPDDSEEITSEQSKRAFEIAEDIKNFILQKIVFEEK